VRRKRRKKAVVSVKTLPGRPHRSPEGQQSRGVAPSSNGHLAMEVNDWLWIPNHSVGPPELVPGLDWGREPLNRFGTKQNCSTFSHAARWSLGWHPHLHWLFPFPPPRTSAAHFSPLIPPSFPVVSDFENPSHFPLPLPSHFGRPPLVPTQRHNNNTSPLPAARRHHRPIWQRPPYSTPRWHLFHEHITNEQLHDAKSARHTLNPTGARERERSQAISTIVL
jgi:hypothetical protein